MEKQQDLSTVRPLARELARELTQEELTQVAGGSGSGAAATKTGPSVTGTRYDDQVDVDF